MSLDELRADLESLSHGYTLPAAISVVEVAEAMARYLERAGGKSGTDETETARGIWLELLKGVGKSKARPAVSRRKRRSD